MDMDQWLEIRCRVLREGVSQRHILGETGMHWRTLKKILAPRATRTCLSPVPLRQIIKTEIPISTYRIGQTTPKAQSGGAKDGLARSVYHVLSDSLVANDPTAPVRRHTETKRIIWATRFISHGLQPVLYDEWIT